MRQFVRSSEKTVTSKRLKKIGAKASPKTCALKTYRTTIIFKMVGLEPHPTPKAMHMPYCKKIEALIDVLKIQFVFPERRVKNGILASSEFS